MRRYVPGAGIDETLVWYEGSGVSDRRFLLTDARGSVIAIANASGVVTARNKYDDYGAPDAGNVGRFQYTGQMWLAEAGLYHYKARAYHPELGRFLQTDPIGYGDGMNMYAYVGNDPVNAVDSSGLIDEIVVQGVNHGYPTGGGFSFGGGGGGGGGDGGGSGGYRPHVPKPTNTKDDPIDEVVVTATRAPHVDPSNFLLRLSIEDVILIVGWRRNTDWSEGLASIDSGFGNCPCLPSEVFLDDFGLRIVAKRVNELTLLRNKRGRFTNISQAGLLISYQDPRVTCLIDISIGMLGALAALERRQPIALRRLFAGLSITAIVASRISCGQAGWGDR